MRREKFLAVGEACGAIIIIISEACGAIIIFTGRLFRENLLQLWVLDRGNLTFYSSTLQGHCRQVFNVRKPVS